MYIDYIYLQGKDLAEITGQNKVWTKPFKSTDDVDLFFNFNMFLFAL